MPTRAFGRVGRHNEVVYGDIKYTIWSVLDRRSKYGRASISSGVRSTSCVVYASVGRVGR